MKSRIVALALICILISSSFLTTVEGYRLTLKISEVNGVPVSEIIKSQKHTINLSDGVATSLDNPDIDSINPFAINIFDGIFAQLFNPNDDQYGIPHQEKI